ECGTGTDLPFEVFEIYLHRRGFGMLFRIARDPETEVRVARFEQSHEFVRMAEAVLGHLEFGRTLRRIPAESHDVPKAGAVDPIRDVGEFTARMTNAGQVRHDRETKLGLEECAYLGCPIPVRAPGAVSDGHEIRVHPPQRRRRRT